MLKKLSTLLLVLTVLTSFAFAQDTKVQPNLKITGEEVGNPGNGSSAVFESLKFTSVIAGDLNYNFVGTNVFTGYDLESNGTPQQIWSDPNVPSFVYMIYTTSSQTAGWTDRSGTYVFSDDMGASWQNGGTVSSGRSGFASISGFDDGRPIATMHSEAGVPAARTQVFVRDAAGSSWMNYTPPADAGGPPIWPRVLGIGTDKVLVTSSINGAPNDDFFTNLLDLTGAGTFSGWLSHPGSQAEVQCIAKSADETLVGMAYIGNAAVGDGSVWYKESEDDGLSWSDPIRIYQFEQAGDSLGAMRGVDITMIGSVPHVVFEVIKQDTVGDTYQPNAPSQIWYWNGDMTTSKMIVDSNNIPYFLPEFDDVSNDVQAHVSRPSIGKSADEAMLFLTVNVKGQHQLVVGAEANTYFEGWFMYSTNFGETFTVPEKFTPDTPLRDWRYISLNPVTPIVSGFYQVMMAATRDSIPGSTVNAPATYPKAVSAELVFVSTTDIPAVGVDDGTSVYSYSLAQNYPNPFNPNTSISFSLPERSNVSLKVYDVLGNEIATLLNDTREAGTHNVTFNSSNLASGMYLYTIKAGSFTSTKKMILMK